MKIAVVGCGGIGGVVSGILASQGRNLSCIELIKEIQKIEGVAGVHVMAIEWEEAVKTIVEGAGLLPRPVIEKATA